MNAILIGAGVGALSGLHASIWGMYKDAVHEGFGRLRFLRSVLIGVAWAHRQWFIAPYAAIWIAVIAMAAMAFTRPSLDLVAQVIP